MRAERLPAANPDAVPVARLSRDDEGHEDRLRTHERRIAETLAAVLRARSCHCGGRRFRERGVMRCSSCGSKVTTPREGV